MRPHPHRPGEGHPRRAVCPGEVDTPILDHRPLPRRQARDLMLQPEDLAQTLLFVAALPARATVELLTINPTVQRDISNG